MSIKKLLPVFICLTQSVLSFGQVFNKSIEANPNMLGSFNIERIGVDSLMMFPAGIVNNALYIHSTLLNGQGDTLVNKNYIESNRSIATGWANSTNRMVDGGFIMGGGLQDTATYGHLIKFDRLGDTVWAKTYGDTANFHTFRQAREATDKSLIVVGEKKAGGWLLKTDSVGNVIWDRHYTGHGDVERLTSVFPTVDGGYVLGGSRRHLVGWPYLNNYDPMLIKVDSTGIEEWSYIHDTPYDDASAYAIQTLDNNYVFASSISTPDSAKRKAALIKVSISGNLLWEKTYGGFSQDHLLRMVKELPDSSLIAVGQRSVGPINYGLMIKTKAAGDSLWVGEYEHDISWRPSSNALWDVAAMADGGFAACGETRGRPNGGPFRQDAWVIRVDSLGCILTTCLVGNESLKPKEENIKLYPNPTRGLLNVESEKPLNHIEIYNLQGQKVKEVKPEQRSFELPEERGLYLIRLTTKAGEVMNQKIVKR